jgi:hypothetical protein
MRAYAEELVGLARYSSSGTRASPATNRRSAAPDPSLL